jgi:peptidylprolyl isomerase
MIRRVASVLAVSAALPLAALTATTLPSVAAAQSTPSTTTRALLAADQWRTIAPENLMVIETSKGRVIVELDPALAPAHVERVQTLARRGFYDGLKFHRVIPNFMAQTGDPQGTGEGGSDLPDIAGEFVFRRGRGGAFQPVTGAGEGYRGYFDGVPVQTQPDAQMFVTADMKVPANVLFCPGVAGMARANSPDSANSQFYLMTGRSDQLNSSYTAFGRVVAGLDVVRNLNAGNNANNGSVANPDIMTRVRLASDIPAAERPSARVMDPRSPTFVAKVDAARSGAGLTFDPCNVEVPAEVTGG